VDTPVWSLALRRKLGALSVDEQRIVQSLEKLIQDGHAQIMGVIRQELLSGMKRELDFKKLRDYLRAFDEPGIEARDYEEAARMNNQCRAHGIAGSGVDFLICSVAHHRKWQIFTTDRDFDGYTKLLPIELYVNW